MDKVAQILKETASSRPSKSMDLAVLGGSSELVGKVQLFVHRAISLLQDTLSNIKDTRQNSAPSDAVRFE